MNDSQISNTKTYQSWYVKPGGKTPLGAKKGVITLSKGLIVVSDAVSGQEVYRVILKPDMKIRRKLGSAFIYYMDGRKMTGRDRQCQFWFYNPKMAFVYGVLILAFSTSAETAKDFVNNCIQAAGVQS